MPAGRPARTPAIAADPEKAGQQHTLLQAYLNSIGANSGYTLYSRRTGGQVARLRPTGENDDVRVLWWRGTGWATPGDFGPLIMPLNEALDFVATESFFWIGA